MNPNLKENPREWQKFTLVVAIALGLVTLGLRLRQAIPQGVFRAILVLLSLALLLCWGRPRWFRRFYRLGMTVSFHLGQFMGKAMLVLFFLIVVTPLGLLLRLLGKDLLSMKRRPDATTYWRPAKPSQQFDQMF
jgi:hypothetical protein